MAEYSDFLAGINIHIGNDVPRVVMIHSVKNMVRKFLDESNAWVYECYEVDVDKDQQSYQLNVPFDSMVCKIWSINGRCGINQYYQSPAHYIEGGQLFFVDLPQSISKLKLVVSLTTTQDALTCPDFVYQNFHDAIVSGAVAFLQMMPSRSWSQPNMASIHQALFDQAVLKAASARDDGFGLSRWPRLVKAHYI